STVLRAGCPGRGPRRDGPSSSETTQPGLDQRGVEADGECGDLADRLLRAGRGRGVAAAPHRRDDLLDQADLAVRGRLEGTQVPSLEPEAGELLRRPGDDEGVGVVVAGRPRDDQTELLQLPEQLLVDLRDLDQLLAGETELVSAP